MSQLLIESIRRRMKPFLLPLLPNLNGRVVNPNLLENAKWFV
ncbi:hypothetical protein [Larkinella ripae]